MNINTNFNEMRIQEIDLEDKEDEEFKEAHEFSVADQKLTINFFANLKAMCYKRSILERRRWRLVLFSEIIIPVLQLPVNRVSYCFCCYIVIILRNISSIFRIVSMNSFD